jgi:hypothetical protein
LGYFGESYSQISDGMVSAGGFDGVDDMLSAVLLKFFIESKFFDDYGRL